MMSVGDGVLEVVLPGGGAKLIAWERWQINSLEEGFAWMN